MVNNAYVESVSSMVFCAFSAPFLPRLGFDVEAVSDFRLVPAAGCGEELFFADGLELCAASLEDDLVPAMLSKLRQRETRRY